MRNGWGKEERSEGMSCQLEQLTLQGQCEKNPKQKHPGLGEIPALLS